MESVAETFGLKVVPIVGEGTILEAVDFVKSNPKSVIASNPDYDMEGVVCRPNVELRDRCGNRVIVKIKWHDFQHLA